MKEIKVNKRRLFRDATRKFSSQERFLGISAL